MPSHSHDNCVSLKEHIEALRMADRVLQEAKESALEKAVTAAFAAQKEAQSIKDRGDAEALRLAREIQQYKDEKANELREQIGSERGDYATKDDLGKAIDKVGALNHATYEKLEATIAPLVNYVTLQQGGNTGRDKDWAKLISAILATAAIVGIVSYFTR
jgi:hypothetical protein